MDSGRRPLCGCFVLSCMVGGIFRKPLGFRRCLPPARPEKAKPFQAGRSPCTKHRQTVRLRLHEPKKVFEGSKGRFFKNAPLAGCGTESHGEEEGKHLTETKRNGGHLKLAPPFRRFCCRETSLSEIFCFFFLSHLCKLFCFIDIICIVSAVFDLKSSRIDFF